MFCGDESSQDFRAVFQNYETSIRAQVFRAIPELLYPGEGGAGIYACGMPLQMTGFSR
jgi:hypothetical protein